MTTQFTPPTELIKSTHRQPLMENCTTPLKEWISHVDCSVLDTLTIHGNYVADANHGKLLNWYCGSYPNKAASVLATDKKMHIKGIIGNQFEVITILVDTGASHLCVSGKFVTKLLQKGCIKSSDIKPIEGKLTVAGIFDEPLQIKEYITLSVLVNNRNTKLNNINVTYKYIIIPKQSVEIIWGIDICIAHKIVLLPYRRQILISSGTDICVCTVRNLKGDWEGQIKDERSPNRLLFEEFQRQIMAPIKITDDTKMSELEIFSKTIAESKTFRPNLKDDKG